MYDSRDDTLSHINEVRNFINEMRDEMLKRASSHDLSKLRSPEKDHFDEWTPRLSSVTYGSDEYRQILSKMKPAIEHHHQNNRHHPEYYPNGISDMNLIDLVEMLCDWKAASLRHQDGDILKSLSINADRHDIPPALVALLKNTIETMGW